MLCSWEVFQKQRIFYFMKCDALGYLDNVYIGVPKQLI